MDPSQPPVQTPQSSAEVHETPTSSVASPTPVQSEHHNGAMEVVGSIITVILLLFFFPLGLIVMWIFAKWPKIVKIIITLFFLIIGAWLAIVGFTVYNALQKSAEEAKNRPGYVENTNEDKFRPADKSIAGHQKAARNFVRKADIETMAQALENHYGQVKPNLYPAFDPNWFAPGGKIPQDPNGGSYEGVPATEVANFKICANLEDVEPNQYCVTSKY